MSRRINPRAVVESNNPPKVNQKQFDNDDNSKADKQVFFAADVQQAERRTRSDIHLHADQQPTKSVYSEDGSSDRPVYPKT
jgi:hypothetical protein